MTKWGFIGTGLVANRVARQIIKSKRHIVVSAYSRLLENRKKFERKHKAYACSNSNLVFFNNEIDAIYIATPNNSHYEYILKAIENNKPVLCEKTFVLNLSQAKEIFALAQQKKLFVQDGMWMAFNPIILEIQKLCKSKKLGEIKKIKAKFSYNARALNYPKRVYDKKLGGGALYDTGVYVISFLNLLLDDYTIDDIKVVKNNSGVDVHGWLFASKGDTKIELEWGIDKFSMCPALVEGTKGVISINNSFFKPRIANVNIENNKYKLQTIRSFIYQFDAVAKAIENKQLFCEEMTWSDTLRVLKTMEIIKEKANITFD